MYTAALLMELVSCVNNRSAESHTPNVCLHLQLGLCTDVQ